MPFQSQKQAAWMRAAEERGEVPKGTSSRWAGETKSMKSLPEYAHGGRSSSPELMREYAKRELARGRR